MQYDYLSYVQNQLTTHLAPLERLLEKEQLAINQVITPLYDLDQQIKRQSEVFVQRIKLLDSMQLQGATELNAEIRQSLIQQYAEKITKLHAKFISVYREQLNNKERPYIYDEQQEKIVKLDETTREYYIERFNKYLLTTEIPAYKTWELAFSENINEEKQRLNQLLDRLSERLSSLQRARLLTYEDANQTSQDLNKLKKLQANTVNKTKELIINDLWGSSQLGNLKQVKKLVAKQWKVNRAAYVNQISPIGCTALHIACRFGFIQIVKFLISSGANPQVTDDVGYQPIHVATEYNQLAIVDFLLNEKKLKVDVNAKAFLETPNVILGYDRTPLHLAAYQGLEDMTKLLLKHGADVNAQMSKEGGRLRSPLHNAAIRGYANIARILLDNKASPSLENSIGESALVEALYENQQPVIEVFCNKGIFLPEQQLLKLLTDAKRKENGNLQAGLHLLFENQQKQTQLLSSYFSSIVTAVEPYISDTATTDESSLISPVSANLSGNKENILELEEELTFNESQDLSNSSDSLSTNEMRLMPTLFRPRSPLNNKGSTAKLEEELPPTENQNPPNLLT